VTPNLDARAILRAARAKARSRVGATTAPNKPTPALLTGTSSEYLGRRPLPRLVRERWVLIVIGPPRVGKSRVGRRLAGPSPLVLDTHDIDTAVVDRIRDGRWSDEVLHAIGLVVDGPVWLRNRPSVVRLLVELATTRAERSLRTVFCQRMADGSAEELMGALSPGTSAVVGLRFPRGRQSRVAIAERRCEELGLDLARANGAHDLDPWTYDSLDEHLRGVEGGEPQAT
jgi:hypothetical protein